MKKLSMLAIILAAVTFVLGIITQLVGHSLIISAGGWNQLTQTFLLFCIGLGVLEYLGKKSV